MSNIQSDYDLRLKRVNDAISLKEPDMVPMVPWVDGTPYVLYPEMGATHKSALYDLPAAFATHKRFHEEFKPDANMAQSIFFSGKANELLEPTMIDWPGRPGTTLPDSSIYQTLEIEYLYPEEYDELIKDYSGYIFNKFLPRAFKGLKGMENFQINPCLAFASLPLNPIANDDTLNALRTLVKVGELQQEVAAQKTAFDIDMAASGFPAFITGGGEVPFDMLSDYFRGTIGTMMDSLERPEKIEAVVDMFADIVIKSFAYFTIPEIELPVRRVFFPMHKGMDGLMSGDQYSELYWRPFQKILNYLIDIDVTPFLYTEGRYSTRTDFIASKLSELPKGKCLVHFEEAGDFADLKKKFEGIACIMGGMPYYLIEHGTKQEVIDQTKYLIDNCAAGGGYLMDASAGLEGVNRENLEAWFETARTYGAK